MPPMTYALIMGVLIKLFRLLRLLLRNCFFLLVVSIFHFNPILTPFLNYGLNATQNLYMFVVDLGGLFFLHILDMATGKCFTDSWPLGGRLTGLR